MSVNYKAIADYCDANSWTDYEVAFTAMSAETVTTDKSEARVTEGMILSGLGLANGASLIDTLEANMPPVVIRVLRDTGINVADSESKANIATLLTATLINQTAHDWLMEQSQSVSAKWPNLKAGHIQNALQMRQAGVI